MSITEKLGKMGIPGFRSGKKWKMAIAIFGYFWIFIILLAIISPSPESTTTQKVSPEKPIQTVKPTDIVTYDKTSQTARTGVYSKFELTNINYDRNNNKIKISGITDLPNNAIVMIVFNTANYDDNPEHFIGAKKDVRVNNGAFGTIFSPPDYPDFASKGKYYVWTKFEPFIGQDSEIMKLVGEKGENLGGDKVEIFPSLGNYFNIYKKNCEHF